MTTLLWLRDDLRLADHEALATACAEARRSGGSVVALWIREQLPASQMHAIGARPHGAATRWWYHRSLAELAPRLAGLGIPLLYARGDPRQLVPRIAAGLGASTVRWSRRYAPKARALDGLVKRKLRDGGLRAHSHPGALLVEPWRLAPASGGYYRVFTPFHRAASSFPMESLHEVPEPLAEPGRAVREAIGRLLSARVVRPLEDLGLLDRDPPWWRDTLERHWRPGEVSARRRLAEAGQWLPGYRERRDLPAEPATARLSPSLRSGEISVRTALTAVLGRGASSSAGPDAVAWARLPDCRGVGEDAVAWARQLYWREFGWHLSYHVPDLDRRPLRRRFEAFPFREDRELLRAWQRGRTGIALVDAGMLELWHTGWMHNRVRMVAASLLSKNMLQPWQLGEQWFWETLVDADEASNPVQWQWAAGCGADAAPYLRVFNPEVQRRTFDSSDHYVDRWLSLRNPRYIPPIVDLKESRRQAVNAYRSVGDQGEC